jgi:hypothetical protein
MTRRILAATVDAAGKVTAVGAGTTSITASVTIGGTTESAIVADDEEDALGLPSGGEEVLLMLQDRDADLSSAYAYAPDGADGTEVR